MGVVSQLESSAEKTAPNSLTAAERPCAKPLTHSGKTSIRMINIVILGLKLKKNCQNDKQVPCSSVRWASLPGL
jgi:hypothetical protein